jgi:clan AA aspartic protease (TIGR02281 family)
MRYLIAGIVFIGGFSVAATAMLLWVGAGMLRQGPPVLVAIAAVALVMLPARAIARTGQKDGRPSVVATGTSLLFWSLATLICFPMYFPGERAAALSTGMSAVEPWTYGYVDLGWAKEIDDWLPRVQGREVPSEAGHEALAKPPPVQASDQPPVRPDPPKTAPMVDENDQVVLPTEGRRGSLRIPVTVEGPRREAEITMIFDTGATLTTLDRATLRKIGIRVPKDAPKMSVHTAAGPRETQVVLVDKVWVGGFEVEGVSIAVCDACVLDDAVGLLGLNVSERFLVTVDGAREELVLSPRAGATNRGSDVAPWVQLAAEATRWPDGRTEVIIEAENTSARWIEQLNVAIQCEETRYAELRGIAPGQIGHVEVSISAGTDCEAFQVTIDSAVW